MSRKVIIMMIAVFVAIVGVRPAQAQDFGFASLDQTGAAKAQGTIVNRGVTGASGLTGFLNTAINDTRGLQANGIFDGTGDFEGVVTMNTVDVIVGDFNGDGRMDIIGLSSDNGGTSARATLFVGLGDGSFGFPAVFSFNTFTGADGGSIISDAWGAAAFDVNLDGITDTAFAVELDLIPTVVYIDGRYFAARNGGVIANGQTLSPTSLTLGVAFYSTYLASSDQSVQFFSEIPSVAFGRIDDDTVADIGLADTNDVVAAILSSGQPNLTFSFDLVGPPSVNPLQLSSTTIGFDVEDPDLFPAPRRVAVGLQNVDLTLAGPDGVLGTTDDLFLPADNDNDLFVAVTGGASAGAVEIFENVLSENLVDSNGFPILALEVLDSSLGTPFLRAGSQTVGAVVTDVNGDNRTDVIGLNRGSGTISTFLATVIVNPITGVSNATYVKPGLVSLAGVNPVSLATLEFNGDGRVDLAVANARGTAGGSTGAITVLTGTGTGVFTIARTFTFRTNGFEPIFSPLSVATGRFDSRSTTDDLVVADGINATFGTPGGVGYISAGESIPYTPVFLPIYTATSLTADFDATPAAGAINDVVIVEQNFGLIFVLLNPGSTAFQVSTIIVQDLFTQFQVKPTSATAFRGANGLNNLAITDVGTPTANSGFGQIVVGLNTGDGLFLDIFQFRQFVATPGATNISGGDFNNDGVEDLAYIDYGSNFAAVALNDGTDFFLTPSFRETGGFQPVSATVGDFNDDDNLDLAALNQGIVNQFNQSIVSILIGQGNGQLVPTGSLLQVSNFGISMVGGLQETVANGAGRVANLALGRQVDFNFDGFADLAVVSTRGGRGSTATSPTPTVTLLINRPDSPGQFEVKNPIELVDDTSTQVGIPDLLDLSFPLFVSGRGLGIVTAFGGGTAVGGASYLMTVGDYNADGSPDLCVAAAAIEVTPALGDPTTDYRAVLYLVGNETAGSMRVSRPIRNPFDRLPISSTGSYGTANFKLSGGDTFVGTSSGEFRRLANIVPDTLHLSLNGNIWIDENRTSILNHAPIVTIARSELNATRPTPNAVVDQRASFDRGRKDIITAGQSDTIRVNAVDVDGDPVKFSLVSTPQGEQPPSFVTLKDNGNNTADITVNSGDINRGPGNAVFRIAVEGSDARQAGPGGRLPLLGRSYFTLIVRPNTPPTIGPVANQTVEATKTATVALTVSDKEDGQNVTTAVSCDKGNFVRVSGTTLTIAPGAGDVGTATCTVTVTDQFGLKGTTTFVVTVTPQNLPPTIANIADQTVKAGQVVTVPLTASDPNGNTGLRLSVVSAPAFVALSDNGNGSGALRIAPALTDTQGGRVTVQVTDPGGLSAQASFNITVQRAVVINAASFAKQSSGSNLFISGIGFGSSGATVTVNGQNVSSRIIGQSDTSITLKGSKKKLSLRSGPNQIVVTSGGIASNTFVLNLLVSDLDEE